MLDTTPVEQSMTQRPATLGDLRESGYRTRSVKQELRENLINRLR